MSPKIQHIFFEILEVLEKVCYNALLDNWELWLCIIDEAELGAFDSEVSKSCRYQKWRGLNLIRLFWGWVLPYISLTYSLSKVSTSILGTWNVWWWRVQTNSGCTFWSCRLQVVSRLQPFPAIKWPLRLHFLVLQEHLDTQAHSCAGCASTSHLTRVLLTESQPRKEHCFVWSDTLWCSQSRNSAHPLHLPFECNFWISMARILKCWSALWITSKTWRMRTRPWGLWTLDAQVECPSDELRAEATVLHRPDILKIRVSVFFEVSMWWLNIQLLCVEARVLKAVGSLLWFVALACHPAGSCLDGVCFRKRDCAKQTNILNPWNYINSITANCA